MLSFRPDVLGGRRLLHPQLDSANDNYRLDPDTCLFVPVSEAGRFHIEQLRLNRPTLVQYRLNRLMAEKTLEEVQKLRELLDKKNRLIRLLKDALDT